MGTYKKVVKQLSVKLRDITHIPLKEVELLLLHILDKNIIWLHLNYDKECDCTKELEKLVDKRATDYPLEYITKRATFYGEVFNVEPGVLIPRPETEILVDKAVEILKDKKNLKVLEIGCGSGIISVMLATMFEDISIKAVDINDKAIALSKSNAIKHNVENKIEFIKSDLFKNIQDESFDIVVSNPPYIANRYKLPKNVNYEPHNALFGGTIGDELLKDIIIQTYNKKIPYLICEMGYDQKKPLTTFCEQNIKYKLLEFYQDIEGLDRGFIIKF